MKNILRDADWFGLPKFLWHFLAANREKLIHWIYTDEIEMGPGWVHCLNQPTANTHNIAAPKQYNSQTKMLKPHLGFFFFKLRRHCFML